MEIINQNYQIMKKLLLLFGICLALFMLRAQTQTFVYSLEGEKVVLEKNDNIQYVHFEKSLIFATLKIAFAICLCLENRQYFRINKQ